MDTLVAKLHDALVDALRKGRPGAVDQPVTVAEIYQDLVPYRSVRSSLGFALNADYEHALLQLLAGQGDLVRIEPPEVRDALRHELNSNNPNVAMFRNYAACDVFVTIPTESDRPSQQRNAGTSKPRPSARERAADSWETALDSEQQEEDNAVDAAREFSARRERVEAKAPPAEANEASAVRCSNCEQALPAGKNVHFCPFCGHDQTKRLCRTCREPLEQGWRFCVQCGTPAAS